MVGFLPDSHIRINGWLSSRTVMMGLCGRIRFHSVCDGIPMLRRPVAREISSDSADASVMHPCLLAYAAIGNDVLVPVTVRCVPEVDLCVAVQPPRSASQYSWGKSSEAVLPTHPTRHWSFVVFTYPISRNSSLSCCEVHFVMNCVNRLTAFRMSNLTVLAAHINFISKRLANG